MYIYMRTYIYIHTHAYTHALTHSYIYVYIYTYNTRGGVLAQSESKRGNTSYLLQECIHCTGARKRSSGTVSTLGQLLAPFPWCMLSETFRIASWHLTTAQMPSCHRLLVRVSIARVRLWWCCCPRHSESNDCILHNLWCRYCSDYALCSGFG